MAEPAASTAESSDRHEIARRRVGEVLSEKWTLDSLLGVGGMAAVYAATHRNGARAAIKYLPFSINAGPELCKRFLREGYLANRVGHDSVVRVLDDHIDYEHEYAYLVMELLEGETVHERLHRDGPFAPVDALDIMISISDCLAAAHAKDIVHRDIKPENIFLVGDVPKILDFGIARALDGSAPSYTRTGIAVGTPAYMSPEQARGKISDISPRSDIFSVGATLLYMVSGELIHDGETAQEVMVRTAWTPPPKALERCSGIPTAVAEVIDRACEFEPHARHANGGELRDAMIEARAALAADPPPALRSRHPAARESPTAAPTAAHQPELGETIDSGFDTRPPPATTTRSPRQPRLLIGGAAAVILGSAITWSALSGEHSPEPIPEPTQGAATLAAVESPETAKLATGEPPENTAPSAARAAETTAPSLSGAPSASAEPEATTVENKAPAPAASPPPTSTRRSALHPIGPKPAPQGARLPPPRPTLEPRGAPTPAAPTPAPASLPRKARDLGY